MKKYYIEVCDLNSKEPYELQSKWYDTEQEALEFANQISFCRFTVSLMSSVWNNVNDCYMDIELEYNIN